MNKFKLFLILGALALTGCETMTVSECKVADWGRVGFADGANGSSESRLGDHVESCAKAGIQPNAQAYRQGWDAGILRFCTPSNGWREGVRGNSGKVTVCRGQPEYEAFAHYMNAGLQVHGTTMRMQQNDAQSNRLQRQLEESSKTTTNNDEDKKRRLRNELRDIDREQFHLRYLLRQQQMLAP